MFCENDIHRNINVLGENTYDENGNRRTRDDSSGSMFSKMALKLFKNTSHEREEYIFHTKMIRQFDTLFCASGVQRNIDIDYGFRHDITCIVRLEARRGIAVQSAKFTDASEWPLCASHLTMDVT